MEHFIRIAFCIVAVALTLSGCRPTTSHIEAEYGLNLLRDDVRCTEPNTRFYTPNITQDGCITRALECFRLELTMIGEDEDCEDPEDRISDTLEVLNMRMKTFKEKEKAPPSSGCKSCEEWDTKPFGDFLNQFTAFLELANSKQADQ